MDKLLAFLLLPLAAGLRTQLADTEYDYIIVGGGTSGLTVANRLSENSSISVLVIERGGDVQDNFNVTNVDNDNFGRAVGTDLDYAFHTTDQTQTGRTVLTLSAGKALGGSSAINGSHPIIPLDRHSGAIYTRTETAEIDAWETLGNEGWNWEALWPYYLKSETLQTPDAERAEAAHLSLNPESHGKTGPLLTGFQWGLTNSSYRVDLNETFQALNVDWNEEVNDGDMVGFTQFIRTIDLKNNVREDAARAYYYSIQDRINLHVLLNTTATKLKWAPNATVPTANGVEVSTQDGNVKIIAARKEIILSAGALVSPLLLELSGVGNPSVLSKYGIDTVVNLPTVGENLQDQTTNGFQYIPSSEFNASYDGSFNPFVTYPSASSVFGSNVSAVAADIKSKLQLYAEQTAAANGNVTRPADLLEFFEMQYDLLYERQTPFAEFLIFVNSGVWNAQMWSIRPFSRGSVHIGSSSPTDGAVINPNYFLLDVDLIQLVGAANFLREVFSTAPFSSNAGAETMPSFSAVPVGAGEDGWKSLVFETYRSNWHYVGTAAMMPREKGGVVDSELRVYGTSNVRVVDASVLPFQLSGHPTSILYAVAERAADLIKGSGQQSEPATGALTGAFSVQSSGWRTWLLR